MRAREDNTIIVQTPNANPPNNVTAKELVVISTADNNKLFWQHI